MIRGGRAVSIAAGYGDEGAVEHQVIEEPQLVRSGGRVALLIDGDNVASDFAGQVLVRAGRLGPVIVKRVYLDPHHLPNWERSAGFDLRVVRAGKNAADMLLAIEAVDLSYRRDLGAVVIVSSDGGFAPLARLLVERGLVVLGLGTATSPADWRKSCSRFEVLTPAAPLPAAPKRTVASKREVSKAAVEATPAPAAPSTDVPLLSEVSPVSRSAEASVSSAAQSPDAAPESRVRHLVREAGDAGVLLSAFGNLMRLQGVTKTSLTEGSWQKYFAARSQNYQVDGVGALARVRWIGA